MTGSLVARRGAPEWDVYRTLATERIGRSDIALISMASRL